jgi:hypothetical protein
LTTKSLEERIQLLEDERDIVRTMCQYSRGIDYGSEEDFADCWIDAAVWEASRRGQLTRRSEGIAQILDFFRKHTHAPEHYHKHPMLEPIINIKGDRAEAESYFLRIDEHPEGPYIYSFGRYRDRLVRCPDGRWRFEWRQNMGEIEPFVKPITVARPQP